MRVICSGIGLEWLCSMFLIHLKELKAGEMEKQYFCLKSQTPPEGTEFPYLAPWSLPLIWMHSMVKLPPSIHQRPRARVTLKAFILPVA